MLSRKCQRGISLVELMVGITVGMIVVAAAAMLAATQMSDNRRMLLEVQVQQDLRATADIVTRELRRAGAWGPNVDGALAGVATTTSAAGANPLLSVTLNANPATEVGYSSSRSAGSTGPYGFRLTDNYVIQSKLDVGSGWQSLTDEATMKVTRFRITPADETAVRIACPKRCADGTTNCWPTVTVRSLAVEIAGESKSDPTVKRIVRSVVRLRNDRVQFNDAANPTLACPV
jgi:type II secretory pathway component PulJ